MLLVDWSVSIPAVTWKLGDVEKCNGHLWFTEHFSNNLHYAFPTVWSPVCWIFDHCCFIVTVLTCFTSPIYAPAKLQLSVFFLVLTLLHTLVLLQKWSERAKRKKKSGSRPWSGLQVLSASIWLKGVYIYVVLKTFSFMYVTYHNNILIFIINIFALNRFRIRLDDSLKPSK